MLYRDPDDLPLLTQAMIASHAEVPAATAPPPPASADSDGAASGAAGAVGESGGAVGSTAAVGTSGQPAVEPAPYSWDEWDGTLDSIPEHIRPHAEPVFKHFQPKVQEYNKLQGEYAKLKTWYDALDADSIDPALRELQTRTETLQSEYDTLKTTHEEAQAGWERYIAEEAQAYEQKLRSEYKEVFANPDAKKLLDQLLDADLDPEYACQTASRGQDFAAKVLEYKQRGSTDSDALKLAEYELGAPARQPRAATLVDDGAPGQRGNGIAQNASQPKTPRELRLSIANRAFAAHSKR